MMIHADYQSRPQPHFIDTLSLRCNGKRSPKSPLPSLCSAIPRLRLTSLAEAASTHATAYSSMKLSPKSIPTSPWIEMNKLLGRRNNTGNSIFNPLSFLNTYLESRIPYLLGPAATILIPLSTGPAYHSIPRNLLVAISKYAHSALASIPESQDAIIMLKPNLPTSCTANNSIPESVLKNFHRLNMMKPTYSFQVRHILDFVLRACSVCDPLALPLPLQDSFGENILLYRAALDLQLIDDIVVPIRWYLEHFLRNRHLYCEDVDVVLWLLGTQDRVSREFSRVIDEKSRFWNIEFEQKRPNLWRRKNMPLEQSNGEDKSQITSKLPFKEPEDGRKKRELLSGR
jgi:hypothetical protein